MRSPLELLHKVVDFVALPTAVANKEFFDTLGIPSVLRNTRPNLAVQVPYVVIEKAPLFRLQCLNDDVVITNDSQNMFTNYS